MNMSSVIHPHRKTALPTAGGILTIIASCVSIYLGWGELSAGINPGTGPNFLGLPPPSVLLWMGVFAILAFTFGLAGGITSLRRKMLGISNAGNVLLIASSFVTVLGYGLFSQYCLLFFGLIFALPIFILSILGSIFVNVSKREFS